MCQVQVAVIEIAAFSPEHGHTGLTKNRQISNISNNSFKHVIFCGNVWNSHRSGGDGVINKVGIAGVTCRGGDGVVHIVAHRAHLP